MDKKENSGGGFGFALILIIIGVILLMNNFGILPWQIWEILIKFWPVILIISGIENILGGNFFGNLLSFLITLIIVFFVFALAISAVNNNFDQWITRKVPSWDRIQRSFPDYKQRKLFKCNPFTDDSCYRVYSQ